MSLLAEYCNKEGQLKEIMADLESLQNDLTLKHELEFKRKLDSLMAQYGYTTAKVLGILDPSGAHAAPAKPARPKGKRRPRSIKVYRNPETGQVIEIRGGNHNVFKLWKQQYGKDVVEGWLQETRPYTD